MPIFPASNGDAPIGAQPQTKWLKRVLIPFWVIRVLAMVLYEVLYVALLIGVAHSNADILGTGRGAYIGSIVAIMVFIGLCLILDLSSMIMLGRHSLRPKTFLIFQVIETTIWLVLIILSIVGLAQISRSSYRRPSPISYILQIVLLASFVALLIYASVIYHRARKAARNGNYAAASTGLQDSEYRGAGYGGAVAYESGPPPSSVHSNPFATPYNRSTNDLSAQPSMELGRTRSPAQHDNAAHAPELVAGSANRYYNPPAFAPGVAELPTYNGPSATRYG